MFFKGKRYLIVGVSLSGAAAAELLLARGALVYLYDDAQRKRAASPGINRYSDLGAVDVSGLPAAKVLEGIYCVVASPGVNPSHRLLELARTRGITIIGELELGARLFKGTVVAITGTNGKSTVTSLVYHIIKSSGQRSFLCGNIGIPITCHTEQPHDSCCCCEVSSFQLEYCRDFRPDISAVLNIQKDHLDRHGTMAKYIAAKSKIFARQRTTEYTVLNFDCPHCRTMFESAHSSVYWFSLKQKVKGAYIEDGNIMFNGCIVSPVDRFPLPGIHNTANCLAAVCIARLYGISAEDIFAALGTFRGIAHRLSFCGTAAGVDIYNDSKGTNTASTLAAVAAMTRPTVIILGGSKKGGGYKSLVRELTKTGKIKNAVCYGYAGQSIYAAALGAGEKGYYYIEEFEQAVIAAYQLCQSGDALLLSPACASYDQFTSFEQRGESFAAIAQRLKSGM